MIEEIPPSVNHIRPGGLFVHELARHVLVTILTSCYLNGVYVLTVYGKFERWGYDAFRQVHRRVL